MLAACVIGVLGFAPCGNFGSIRGLAPVAVLPLRRAGFADGFVDTIKAEGVMGDPAGNTMETACVSI
jgi:hypothetical protein